MIDILSYKEAYDAAENVRNGSSTDKVLMVVFTMSNCEVCQPWMKEVIELLAERFKEELTVVQVYIDKEPLMFPPPQVPTSYFFVPGRPRDEYVSRLGPAPFDFVERDVARFVNMKNEKKSLYQAFYNKEE